MPQDPTIPFASDDPDMDASIELAQMSLGVFFAAFCQPKKNQRAFLLKVHFEESGESEHIWLADLDLSNMPSRGVIANEPKIPRLKFMQTAEFLPAQITDWMYVEDDILVGGFTTKLIRRRMTEEERTVYDAEAPYKFLSDAADMAALKKAWDALEDQPSA